MAQKSVLAFALFSIFSTSEAISQPLDIGNTEVTFVEASLYKNSELKRLRNSTLFYVAPNVLKSVWPRDGYDVETVRNLACDDQAAVNERSLGNKLTFVRAIEGLTAGGNVDGVEIDFKRLPESGPQLSDLCTWLPEVTGPLADDAYSITDIIRQFDVLNPPSGGTWQRVAEDEQQNAVDLIFEYAEPILVGEVGRQGGDSILYWQTNSNAFLNWSTVSEDAGLNGSHLANNIMVVWQYYLPGDQIWNSGYYLTTRSDVPIDVNDNGNWISPKSEFSWDVVLLPDAQLDVVLWAKADVTNRWIEDDWYFVTDEGFPDLDPKKRFEKQLFREQSIDADVFLAN